MSTQKHAYATLHWSSTSPFWPRLFLWSPMQSWLVDALVSAWSSAISLGFHTHIFHWEAHWSFGCFYRHRFSHTCLLFYFQSWWRPPPFSQAAFSWGQVLCILVPTEACLWSPEPPHFTLHPVIHLGGWGGKQTPQLCTQHVPPSPLQPNSWPSLPAPWRVVSQYRTHALKAWDWTSSLWRGQVSSGSTLCIWSSFFLESLYWLCHLADITSVVTHRAFPSGCLPWPPPFPLLQVTGPFLGLVHPLSLTHRCTVNLIDTFATEYEHLQSMDYVLLI